jgi:hypothetical protein
MAKTKKIYVRKPKVKEEKHVTEAAQHKGDFRKTPRWKFWRRFLIDKQKKDPITGSKLTKGANCHHMDMREENYENLDEKRFRMLNKKSHDTVHFFFAMKDWRAGVKALVEILEYMEKYNTDNPNWSFDDANNRAWPVE